MKRLNLLERGRPGLGLGLARKENTAKWIVKFDGEDEKKGDMIQCCLCNIWFHVECIMVTKTKGVIDRIIIEDTENNETTTTGPSSTAENQGVSHQPTDHSSLESQMTKLLDEQPEDTESQDPKSTDDSEEVENYEDDIVTNSVSASDKSDTEGNVDGNIDDLNDKVWICENCKSLPSEIHKLKQSNMNIEKELKSIKDILEDIHKGSTNENKIEHKTQFQNNQGSSTETTPQPASCQCAHKHNPNHGNKSNIQYMMENKSEIETKRIIVEENIVLKKENGELRDRLTIYERALDQILRDQEDKRMQISTTEEWYTQKKPGRKPQERVSKKTTNLATYNSFQVLSESDSEESTYDYEAEEPSTSKENTKVNHRICTSESTKQAQKQAVLSERNKATKQRHVKDKVFLLGDPQLHRIDEERLSSRNMKTLVRSKGRLKV